jgi:phospholipid transport system substrate-binding protein
MIRSAAILGVVVACLTASIVQAAIPAAGAPIEALDQALQRVMQEGKATPFATRYAMLAPIVQQTFDLDTILETSVGPRWQAFSPADQQQIRDEFLKFTVASYVSNFNSYNGERFEISPDTRAIGNEQVVSTKIVPASGDPARIDYVMKQGSSGWRAVDVLLDGSISRIAVQRSDFRSLVEGGPTALVESLRRKVSDLSHGAGIE